MCALNLFILRRRISSSGFVVIFMLLDSPFKTTVRKFRATIRTDFGTYMIGIQIIDYFQIVIKHIQDLRLDLKMMSL